MVHLPLNILHPPVALLRVEEVDAQSARHYSAAAVLLPVYGEGEELVAAEVHHREQFVHQSVSQPLLRLLCPLLVCVPTVAPVPA